MTSQPRVVLIHRYFRPDTPPYAAMLAEIASALASDGFDVQVITAQPSYGDSSLHDRAPSNEVVDGVHVIRVPLLPERKDQTLRRGVNLLLFAAQVWWRVRFGPRVDAVMAATTPPVLVAFAASQASRGRGVPFVYHNQDIYPEVLGQRDGTIQKRLLGALKRVDLGTGRRSSRVVVLSEDMDAAWRDRGLEDDHPVAVINNFDPLDGGGAPAGLVPPPADGVRRIVFAGNVGKFQDVPGLVAAVERLHSTAVELVIVGDGADLERAKAEAGRATTFVGRVSAHDAAAWVESSDLAVVSLSPTLIRYVYPSKTFGYLSRGVPVLARVETDSELAGTIVANDVGWVADPEDPAGLDAALRDFLSASEETLALKGKQARNLSEQWGLNAVTSQWTSLFRSVVEEGPAK